MNTIYYDLSEQFHASALKFRYYGIARTVMEVGYELAQSDADVRFVVFSPAHDRFFEVFPRFGNASPTGICDPNLPVEAQPKRIRYSFPETHMVRDLFYPLARRIVRRICMRRWRAVPEGHARVIDMAGKTLVSLGRPKMLADYLVAMEEAGVKMDFIPLLHDMIPFHHFANSSDKAFARNFAHDNAIVIRNARMLLTNSVFTKEDVEACSALGYLPDHLPKIVPVPLAHEFRPTDEAIHTPIPTTPYILCVGTMTGRKNLECAVEALLLLHQDGRSVPQLVLAGAHRKRTGTYLNHPRFSPIRDRIVEYINPNQAELGALYENALALVMTSRMEGWGLPLGEAMWLGTPGFASTAPALQEVGGTTACYFDPDAPQELANLIYAFERDPDARSQAQARTRAARPKLRTWANVAQDLLAAVNR
jgi:glycosyltransferase involved in cell wall biosynthesis